MPPVQLAPLHHRDDIEGLRGVAVLAVTAVHTWPELLRGGFVGVDIFFVLSGYLISAILFREMAAGRFSLADFYARRVRRLLPALCLVLAATLLAAVLLAFPSQARQIGWHVAAGALFSSNLALWREAGYFDASSETKPLLHLWSLGIEEQFYILWPLAALAVVRWRRQGGWLLLALLLGSFLLNVGWVEAKGKATFFLLPTRAWELLMGAALAWHQRSRLTMPGRWPDALQRWLPDTMAVAGVAAIAAALLLLDKERLFPGWWALLPTTGTVLLLAAGPGAWFNRRVLAHPVLVFYGAISYPLYLWHWPLLVFPQLAGVTLDDAVRVLILTASVALAALTREYIERPLRRGAAGPRTVHGLVGLLAALGLAGLALQQSDGLVRAWPQQVQAVARSELRFDWAEYRGSRCFLDLEQGPAAFAAECAGGSPPLAATLLLWGDSHAASLYPGLQAAPGSGVAPLAQYTKARCPPLIRPPAGSSRGCADVNAQVMATIARQPPSTVVLGGFWSLYGEAGGHRLDWLVDLDSTVRALQAAGVRRVVVIGHLPSWTSPLPQLLLGAWRSSGELPERSAHNLDPLAATWDDGVRRALAGSGGVFVSPMDLLCSSQGCRVTLRQDGQVLPLSHDRSHLTSAGSRLLIELGADQIFDAPAGIGARASAAPGAGA